MDFGQGEENKGINEENSRLREELRLARAEIAELSSLVALRQREIVLQRNFEEYRERKRRARDEAVKLRILYVNLLFENNPNTLFLFDEDLRYVLGSRRFFRHAMPDNLAGRPFVEVFSGRVNAEWLAKIQRQCAQVVETKEGWRYNDLLHLGRDETLEAQVILSPVVQDDGACRGVLVSINDVSELAEARHRAEDADRMKSSFLAQMSHEIRTPMNAIVGIAEILLHDRTLAPDQRKFVTDIQLSSTSLLTIINDILDFSKLDSGKMPIVPIHFDLLAMLDNVCSLISYMAAEKNLAFRMETAGCIPQYLYGDDVRLRQILLNLLGNAVKFTRVGGVTLRVEAKDGMLVFRIKDTGVGIKREEQEGLFQPFQQSDIKKLRNVQGTGLGLSISSSLVTLMKGEIKLESEYGKGSTFMVTLPLTPGLRSQVTTMARSAAEIEIYSNEARVLVVDDNEINLNVAAGLLRTLHGIDCDLAGSGPKALEMAAAVEYHLVLMDHMMPDMDGVETTKRLREAGGHNAEVPIVALTANAVAGTREMLLDASMNDFVGKPINKGELARVLRSWLPERLRAGTRADSETGKNPASLRKVLGIRELDCEAGLEMAGGNVANYESALKLLSRKVPESVGLMRRLLWEEGDVAMFSVHVHGMKSSLASVGAEKLAGAARSLEMLSRAGDEAACRDEFPAFSARLSALGDALSQAFRDACATGETKIAAGGGELEALLPKLREALLEYDYDGITVTLGKLTRYDFGGERNAVLAEVGELAEAFDYSSALEMLDAGFVPTAGA